VREYTQMNELADRFGDKLNVFGVPCNQFGHQSTEKDFETLAMLRNVRPGGGYEPRFPLSTRVEVNGADAHPLFKWLRAALPMPHDDAGGHGSEHIMDNIRLIIWSPVTRSDVTWNFEKFLVNQDGVPVRRYSPKFPSEAIARDIEMLIAGGPGALGQPM